jgi:hypothetical protein
MRGAPHTTYRHSQLMQGPRFVANETAREQCRHWPTTSSHLSCHVGNSFYRMNYTLTNSGQVT